jgi:hypothetical protein
MGPEPWRRSSNCRSGPPKQHSNQVKSIAAPSRIRTYAQGLRMRPGPPFKIIIGRHKYPILPSGKYFAITVRPAESVHYLPPISEALRPRCGLASHDHLESHPESVRDEQDASKPRSSRSDLMIRRPRRGARWCSQTSGLALRSSGAVPCAAARWRRRCCHHRCQPPTRFSKSARPVLTWRDRHQSLTVR